MIVDFCLFLARLLLSSLLWLDFFWVCHYYFEINIQVYINNFRIKCIPACDFRMLCYLWICPRNTNLNTDKNAWTSTDGQEQQDAAIRVDHGENG